MLLETNEDLAVDIGKAIKAARKARGMTQRELAAKLDVSVQAVSQWESGESNPSSDKLLKISDILDIFGRERRSPPVDEGELSVINPTMQPAFIAGTVEAGAFREVDELDQSEPRTVWVPRDPEFPNARMLVFEVAGTSMNDLKPFPIFPGMQVSCLSYEDVADRMPLRDGMIVVVQRSRDGGHTREWSLKQIEYYPDRVEFHPRSTDPRHKPIVVNHDYQADEGTSVEIIGILRNALAPF